MNLEEIFSFHSDDTIVIGCSTGPDSMALLDMLMKLEKKYSLKLIVAHVNHNIRKESVYEESFLKKFCENHSLLFESMIIEEYGDDNFHNEARNIRYHFFEDLIYKYNAQYLMTAHHGDDLIETILMRIIRGSNLFGYSGFKEIVDMGNYKIVRPLIHFTKDELLQYDITNHVPYFIDSSNEKDKYTRNRYRKYVLPFLKEEDKDVHKKFLKFSNELDRVSSFILFEREKALSSVMIGNVLSIESFCKLDEYMQREVLYYLLGDFYQDDLILLSDKHIDLILNLIYSNKANSFVNLPNEVIANKCYNFLEFKRNTETIASYEVEFDQFVSLPNDHFIEQILDTDINSNDICRLDTRELKLPLIVRTRRFGDRIAIKGLNGTKKIKDIFIDKKMKLDDRDSWPIVTDSCGKIVWIPGIKKSKYDKKKSEFYDIILKYS